MTRSYRHPNAREPASLPAALRRVPVAAEVRRWVESRTGAVVIRIERLPGASSTAVHCVHLVGRPPVVLRRYVWDGFLLNEPDAPVREVDALGFASSKGLAAPDMLAADVTGEEVGDGVPALLMTRLPGRAIVDADPFRLAEVAARIHSVDPAGFCHEYFPWYADTTTAPPAATSRPELWEKALEVWHEEMPAYDPVFVHRDFHPGNVLWSRGQLGGVVDWANACRGPRGCDVAHCRANLAGLAGEGAADEFEVAYFSLTGVEHHPYWELASVLENDLGERNREELARAEVRLERALRSIG